MAKRKGIRSLVPPEAKGLKDLLDRTLKARPKPKDIAALRCYLEQHPELWHVAGDMARLAYDALVDELSPQEGVRESLKVGRQALRDELGYKQASSLERLLIDHVVLCWLRLNYLEFAYTDMKIDSMPIPRGDYWERKLSAAQRRYLRASETLARICRLRLPAMQINVADQQVNVAGSLVVQEGARQTLSSNP